MKIQLRHKYKPQELDMVDMDELVALSCETASRRTRGELETLRVETEQLRKLFGTTLKVLHDRGLVTMPDLAKIFDDLGDWKIDAEEG